MDYQGLALANEFQIDELFSLHYAQETGHSSSPVDRSYSTDRTNSTGSGPAGKPPPT